MKFAKKDKVFLTICAIAEVFLVPAFIRQFGDPSNMVMFVTCHDDGRLVTLWEFDGNVSASENFVKID